MFNNLPKINELRKKVTHKEKESRMRPKYPNVSDFCDRY